MKILCVSDQIDPLIYSINASKNFPDIDLILCAGDLPMDYIDFIVSVFNKPTYFVFGNHNLNEFRYYHPIPGSSNSAPAAAIQGMSAINMDSSKKIDENKHNYGAIYAGFKNLALKSFKIKNQRNKETPLLITGISGSIKYNNGLCQYTDKEMMIKLIKLIPGLLYNKIRYGRYLDIFLTHATPYKVHDHSDPCHVGFKAFNWFIKKFKPAYMLHGHIHLYDLREERISKYMETTVINVFAHHVLELDENLYKGEQ